MLLANLPDLWPWQLRGLDLVLDEIKAGFRFICVYCPTGMGKTRFAAELVNWFAERDKDSILYTNKRLLTGQTHDSFNRAGLQTGYLANNFFSEHDDSPLSMVKIASLQTVRSRLSRKRMELPMPTGCVIIDEAHNKGFDPILTRYRGESGSLPVIGLTATPVGLRGKYDVLVQAGTKREGRAHGSLVPCTVFAPTEPDMKGVKMNSVGEFVRDGMTKRVMQCTVFSDVFDNWLRHNGDGRPTLLWAPGVPESRWFVEEFRARGVTAEHIDGETSDEERARIQAGSRDGSIKVVSSFGVLREGVDWPWVAYGILVQVCGALSTYLQLVGRLLRKWPGKDSCILQDHSGAWHRHGSPNADRDWKLSDTDKSIAKAKLKARRENLEAEPICCPKCHGIRMAGPKCPHCGYEHTRSIRMVRTEAGELKRMVGNVVKHKKKETDPQKIWMGCLYACGGRGMTVGQAAGLFKQKTGNWPTDVRPMPEQGSLDWKRKAAEVYPWTLRRGKAKAK